MKISTNLKDATRRRITEAALDVFSTGDFHEATLRKIAKQAGIAPSTIYKHFESKEELLNNIITVIVRKLIEDLQDNLLGSRGTLGKLRKMTWFYLHYFERNPKVAWLLYVTISYMTWYEFPDAYQLARDTGGFLHSILREGQETGEVSKSIDIRLVMRIYFGCLRLLVSDWLVRNRSHSLIGYADDLTEAVYTIIIAEGQSLPL